MMLKSDGRLKFLNDEGYLSWVAEQQDGKYYRVTFRPAASGNRGQLRYYYGVVLPTILAWMGQMGWSELGFTEVMGTRIPIGVNAENLDRWLKVLYASSRGLEEIVQKSKMSHDEMRDYLDFILNWCHEQRIGIPSNDTY
jgi:hypothetical protein